MEIIDTMRVRKVQKLQENERPTKQQQQEASSKMPVSPVSLTQFRETMAILLSTLQTVPHTITGVAYTLPAEKAKSDMSDLSEIMVPLNTLAGDIVKPQQE